MSKCDRRCQCRLNAVSCKYCQRISLGEQLSLSVSSGLSSLIPLRSLISHKQSVAQWKCTQTSITSAKSWAAHWQWSLPTSQHWTHGNIRHIPGHIVARWLIARWGILRDLLTTLSSVKYPHSYVGKGLEQTNKSHKKSHLENLSKSVHFQPYIHTS